MCPFLKSYINQNEAQDATDYSPYVDKQYNNYINDINNGFYTNNSLVNGKSIESTQPFINIARHFHLISEMSVNYLATLGNSMGFAPTLDNPKVAKYQQLLQRLQILLPLLVMVYLIIVCLPLLQIIK